MAILPFETSWFFLSICSALFLTMRVQSEEILPESIKKTEVAAHFQAQDGKRYSIGLGSGLAFNQRFPDKSFELLFIADRGPNAEGPLLKQDKSAVRQGQFFLTPDYIPRFSKVRYDENFILQSIETISLQSPLGPVSGLIPPLNSAIMPEVGLTLDRKELGRSELGFDPEGITAPRNGTLWLADEYRPGLVEVDALSGEVKRILSPGNGLPVVLSSRQPNRGFEAVTRTPSGSVVAVVQSTLDISGKTRSIAPMIRIVVYSPHDESVKMYAYLHGVKERIEDVKIGDITAITDSEFVLIQSHKEKNGDTHAALVGISLNGATPIHEQENSSDEIENFETLSDIQVTPVKSKLLTSLHTIEWGHSKTEGLALLDDGKTLAIAQDNDFGTKVSLEAELRELTMAEDGTLQLNDTNLQNYLDVKVIDTTTHVWFLTYKDLIINLLKFSTQKSNLQS
jgi:Esterase-like activity of phytase